VLASAELEPWLSDLRQPRLRGRSLDECVGRLLEQLPARFALVGHSLGAIVALALTRRASDRVSRLALLAANPRPPRPDQQDAWAAQRRALADGASARSLQEQLLPVLVPAGRRTELEEAVLVMADEVGESDLDDQLAIQQTRVDERPALAWIGVPTLLVAGAEDALVPVARHDEIQARVTGSHALVLARTGHLAPLEEPVRVAAALARWLGEPASLRRAGRATAPSWPP
jgi:pimeloyl-ACP methyl ester carboxylesterase